MDFINLDRYFVPLAKDQEPSLDTGRIWGPRIGGWLGWDDLRRRRRVILLAEAASGKTEEFRHQCDALKSIGIPAFFLRIEELAEQGTETALDAESAQLFEAWLAGSSEGWFFLDSVDEARLNRKSFDTSLKRFARDIGDGRERAHVYVSCRVTDWKGAEDRATYSRYLPAWKKPIVAPIAKPDDYSALLDPIFEKKRDASPAATSGENEESLNQLLVVQLIPLKADQYRTLATAAGVTDVAWAAIHTKETFFAGLFARLTPRVEGKGAAWAVAHRITKIVWLVLHQEVEYQEKGSAPPNERTLVRKFKRLLKEFGSVGLDVRALLDQQLPAPA